MTGRRAHIGLLLLVGAPALLSACPRPAKAPAAPVSSPARDSESTAKASIAGSYLCELDSEPPAECSIARQAGALHFQLQAGADGPTAHTLVGSLQPTAYGFRLEGRFDAETLALDFMRQGGGSFAAVIQLADLSLHKLNVRPRDSASTTSNTTPARSASATSPSTKN